MLHLSRVAARLLAAASTTLPLHGGDITLPPNDPRSEGAMGAGAVDPEYEAAAREPSFPGKIRGEDRFVLARLRKLLAESLAALPEGPEGRGSPWLPKFQAVQAGLDKVLASQTHEDCLALIPLVAEVLPAWKDYDSRFHDLAPRMNVTGTAFIHTAARYVEERRAKVSPEQLRSFVMLFSIAGYYSEGDWEGELMPIDCSGVMILNPVAVMDYLKTLPPRQVGQFYGNWDLATAFDDYEEAGTGMTLLKALYAANREQIRAKWSELADWVAKHPEEEE